MSIQSSRLSALNASRTTSWIRSRLPGLLVAIGALVMTVAAPAGAATPQLAAPYGEVRHFGSFDATATEAGKFVLPVGFAVDPNDSSMPDHTAVYVLDNLNPQNDEGESSEQPLQYRIQKLSDSGAVVGAATFSITGEPAQNIVDRHALSLTVDGAAGRVYVLVDAYFNEISKDAAERIDVWSTTPVSGALPAYSGGGLSADPVLTGQAGALLAGPAQLYGAAGASAFFPEGMTVAGTEAGGDLVLAGERGNQPLLERIATQGAHAGEVDGAQWSGQSALSGVETPNRVTSVSHDPNGEVDATFNNLGSIPAGNDDEEPYLATISSNLSQTTQVLPDSLASGDQVRDNPDRGAMIDLRDGPYGQNVATNNVTHYPYGLGLGPDEVGLGGGIYAGLDAHIPGPDTQNPAADPENAAQNAPYSWTFARTVASQLKPASLAIRLFDAAGDSLGMIGNVTAGGACNLEGGQSAGVRAAGTSFVALAAGAEGMLFALVQTDLSHGKEASLTEPAGHGQGDEVFVFKPGAGSGGVAGNQCPQPSGSFKINGQSSDQSVQVGSAVSFDASAVALQGGSPWAYEWDLDGNSTNGPKSDGFETAAAWSELNTQAAPFGAGLTAVPWAWAEPTASRTYCVPGTYPIRLRLVNDFGAYDAQRTLTVNPATEGALVSPTPSLSVSANPTQGQSVSFTAAAQAPVGETITDYHWEFGDGASDDTGTSPTDTHVYANSGPETVTLTVTDSSSCATQGSVAKPISVAAIAEAHPPVTITPTPGPTTTPARTTPEVVTPGDTGPTLVQAHVASAASAQGTVAVSVSCPASKPTCSGTVTLATAGGASTARSSKRPRGHPKPVSLGHATFMLAGGRNATVQVKLSSKGLALLRSKRTLAVIATIVATDPGGHSGTVSERLTLHSSAAKQHGKRRTKHH